MSRAILERSLAKLRASALPLANSFDPQEMAVLRAFHEQRSGRADLSSSERKLHDRIAELLSAWRERPRGRPGAIGPEQHAQTALREAIDKALSGHWDSLKPDEQRIIEASHRTLRKGGPHAEGSGEARLLALLEKVAAAKPQHRNASGPADKPALESKGADSERDGAPDEGSQTENDVVVNTVDPKKAFADIQRTPMSILAEIEVDLNPRVFKYKGNTLIQGNVPSDVLVEVEDGALRIHGNLLGSACALGDVVIEGNVQGGLALSLSGNIQAGEIQMRSKLIARGGSVSCGRVEAPELIFAWHSIQISGPVIDGHIVGSTLRFEDKVMSATIESCGPVQGVRFETGKRGPTVICLRDGLRCNDYDRAPKGEIEEELRQLREAEEFIERAKAITTFTSNMVHSCYRTGLFYLLGGVENAAAAVDLIGLNVLAMYMEQILAVADTAAQQYERFMEEPNEGTADAARIQELEDILKKNQEPLQVIRQDIEALPEQFGVTHRRYLLDRCEDLRIHIRRLLDDFHRSDDAEYLTNKFQPAVSEWRERLRESERKAAAIVRNSGLDEETMEKIQSDPDALGPMLETTVKEQSVSESQTERSRAGSPLIRLLQEQSKRFTRSMEHSQKGMQESIQESKELRAKLYNDSVLQYGETRLGACYVEGEYFDEKVVITADPHFTEGQDVKIGKAIAVAGALSGGARFVRHGPMIMREH